MNRMGVTQYQHHDFKRAKRTDGKFAWPDPANREGQLYSGATDLTDNVSWGWHHPSGIFNTIPVGSPLIDDQSNIYLGADDSIRKFSVMGDIMWSYAPRGQLAAAPTLVAGSTRRLAARMQNDMSAVAEDLLRPDWAKDSMSNSDPSFQFFKDFKVGDVVKVKPGLSYRADGKELYKDGDQGLLSGFVPGDGRDSRAVIQWTRTGHKTVLDLHAIKNRFVRVQATEEQASLPPMIVGSTTAGYVFAIDIDSGEELWATWASNDIAGVKGAVAAKDGIVVVATDRCSDRYCYRYRNQTNAAWPGNQMVRGLSAADGSAVWEYKTTAPVWNMVPLWGPGSSVLFQDYEGRVYSLDLQTGALNWKAGGNIGTNTNAAAVYSSGHNMVFALGVGYYQSKHCNPYVAPGILVNCNTWPGVAGFIRGYNATSGHRRWETHTPEPPASAAVGMLNSPPGHTRLVVTMGYNCFHNSPTQLWSVDPHSGHIRWERDGPTLWAGHCAGDKEGADIRRAMGGRAACVPNSWSAPAIDSNGDVYVGNQVGVLQKYGSPTGRTVDVALLSTLTTGHAFQDAAIAFGDGIMAVSTCTSLIVLQTYTDYFTDNVTVTAPPNLDGEPYGYNPTRPPA
jgi:outer membrane protein assembly factor BamB